VHTKGFSQKPTEKSDDKHAASREVKLDFWCHPCLAVERGILQKSIKTSLKDYQQNKVLVFQSFILVVW